MFVVIAHSHVPDDAREDERDVLVQAEVVRAALVESGHSVELLPVTLDLSALHASLLQRRPQIVFNLVESLAGSDRLAPLAAAVIEQSGVPLTGSGSDALWLSNHKILAKRHLALAQLPTPAWQEPSRHEDTVELGSHLSAGIAGESMDRRFDEGTAFIIKPVFEHASRGLDASAIVMPRDSDDLSELIRRREQQLGEPCFAEQFVEGREFNVSLLASETGCEVLPLAEIDFSAFPEGKPRIVDYRAKWVADSFEFRHTPRRFLSAKDEPQLQVQLSRDARRCWAEFQLGGYVRVDFRVDDRGRPWILEINTNPCLSPDAGFAAALHQSGIRFRAAVDRILADGLRARLRVPARPQIPD
jgi:D-alanine-D-alanine ligase